MKRLAAILLLTAVVTLHTRSASAQKFIIEDASITVYADTATAKEAFKFTDMLLSGKQKIYDRYVIKNDTVYYRAGIGVFRKPPIYIVKDGKMVKARIR